MRINKLKVYLSSGQVIKITKNKTAWNISPELDKFSPEVTQEIQEIVNTLVKINTATKG